MSTSFPLPYDEGSFLPDDDYASIPEAVDLPEDIYERIVRQVQGLCDAIEPEAEVTLDVDSDSPPEFHYDPIHPPLAPESLRAAGISQSQVSDLILKLMYLNGTLTGFEISRQLKLPFGVLAETLYELKYMGSVEMTAGETLEPVSCRYQLTDQGRNCAREAFETCRYVGPAPVSLEHYTRQCQLQAVKNVPLNWTQLQDAMQDLVIEPELLQRLGPAVCSGQSIFIYGPSGNGKTVIAKGLARWLHQSGNAIFVPYAISVDNQIISIFDPNVHRPVTHPPRQFDSDEVVETDESAPATDLRWRKVRRPMVIAGGELSLDMLDLRFHSASGYYTAPMHVKANGGVFLLDDFGRQLAPATQLLNRWILPLEERMDSLTLHTGKKFTVPFEQLTIFSTNLHPDELVDASFLRRIRHKIEIGYPSDQKFRDIFRKACEQRDIKYDDWIVSRLLETQYSPENPPKASDPRDLLDVIAAICRFRGERPHLSERVVMDAYQDCVCGPRLAR